MRRARRWSVFAVVGAVVAVAVSGALAQGSNSARRGSAAGPSQPAGTAPSPTAPGAGRGTPSGAHVTSPAAPAPAPASASTTARKDQLAGLYQDLYSTVQDALLSPAMPAGDVGQIPAPAEFDDALASLSPSQSASLADAIGKIQGWAQMPSVIGHTDQEIRQLVSTPATSGTTPSSAAPAPASALTSAAPLALQAGTPSLPTQTFIPSTPVTTFQPASCPTAAINSQAGESTIFALTLTGDAIGAVDEAFPKEWIEAAFSAIGVDPDPIEQIFRAAKYVVQGIIDLFQFLYNMGADCSNANTTGFESTIDNTTYQTFVLLGEVQADEVTISNQVDVLEQQQEQPAYEGQLRREVEASLGSSSAVPPVAFVLPTCDGGFLGTGACLGVPGAVACPANDATPAQVTVEEVVTCDLHALIAAGQPVDPASLGELALANQAAETGQYKTAYSDYQTAYQEVTR